MALCFGCLSRMWCRVPVFSRLTLMILPILWRSRWGIQRYLPPDSGSAPLGVYCCRAVIPVSVPHYGSSVSAPPNFWMWRGNTPTFPSFLRRSVSVCKTCMICRHWCNCVRT